MQSRRSCLGLYTLGHTSCGGLVEGEEGKESDSGGREGGMEGGREGGGTSTILQYLAVLLKVQVSRGVAG